MAELSKWESKATKIKEEFGALDPVVVNNMEKSKWEIKQEQLNANNIKKTIQGGGSVSYGDMSWGKAIQDGISKLPSDTIPFYKDYLTSIYTALRHPVITGQELKGFGLGAIKTGIVRQMGAELNMKIDESKMQKHEDIARLLAFEQEMYKKWGTEENLKRFIAEHPAEALQTIGEMLIPAGKLAGGAAGKVMQKTGAMLDPLNLTKEAVKKPATLMMNLPKIKNIPDSLYRRAIKFKKEIPFDKQDHLIKVALKNGTALNMKSYIRLSDQIDELGTAVDSAVDLANPNIRVSVKKILESLDPLEKELQAVSSHDVSSVFKDIRRVIKKNNKAIQRTDLNAREMQEMKKRFGHELSDAYQKAMAQAEDMPLKNEAKMAINRTLKETIEQLVPETALIKFEGRLSNRIIQKTFPKARKLSVKEINRLEGDLINLRKALSKSVNEIRSGSLMDFQLTAKTATGASAMTALSFLATGEASYGMAAVGGLVGLTFGVLDSNPLIKSKLAIYLNDLKSFGINVNANGTLIRMGLYEAGDYKYNYPGQEKEGPEGEPLATGGKVKTTDPISAARGALKEIFK